MASIMDLILRVMGNSGQFREDMQQDKMVLEDFINSVHDINIDVKLEDADAKEKLDVFKAELDELHNKTANIDLDDAAAREQLEQFKLKLDELRNQAVRINLDDEHAKEELDAFKLKWDELRNQAVEIKVNDIDANAKLDALQEKEDKLRRALIDIDVNDADAKVKVDDIKLKLDSIHDARVNIDVDDAGAIVQIDELDRKLDGLEARIQTVNRTPINPGGSGGAAGDGGRGGGMLVASILAALPLISPLAAVAAGAIGSIGSALVSATAGAVGFGVVATSNIKDVTTAQQKLKAAQDAVNQAQAQVKGAKTYQEWLVATENLKNAHAQLAQTEGKISPPLLAAVNALNQFEAKWKSWTASFQPTVLSAFEKGLSIIEKLMTDMTPVINAAGKAINGLLDGLDKDLGSAGAAKFFKTLAETTGPAILAFGQSAANIFSGLGGIFEAFAPTFGGMEKGLVSMTARFAAWGQSLGSSNQFKQFLEYLRQETPQVLSLIGNLSKVVMDLLKAMAPAGAVLMPVVNGILKLIDAVLNANPIIGQLGVAIMEGISIMKLLSPVLSGVMTAIRFFAVTFLGASEEAGAAILGLSGPIGWIIAAVIAAVILIVTHWKQVVWAAQEVWKGVVWYFNKLGDNLRLIWDTIVKIASAVWNSILDFFRKWGPTLLEILLGPIGILVVEIAKHWDSIVHGVEDLASRFVDRFNTIVDFLKNLPGQALQWGENMMHMLAQGIENGISWVEGKVKSVSSSIKSFLGFGSPTEDGPGATSDRWMPNLMNMLANGIEAGTPKVRAALNKVIVPPGAAVMMGAGGTGSSGGIGSLESHVHIYGNVYSVDDIEAAAQRGAHKVLNQFAKGVKVKGRTMGYSG